MMNIKYFGSLLLLLGLSSSVNAASTDPLVGKWKTIDDRTGYSLADVIINKNENSQKYTATIIHIRNVPGALPVTTCTQCTGKEKNKPLIGLTILTELTALSGKQTEFRFGQLLDPNNGKYYNARAKLMNNGKHLIIHTTNTQSTVGRNITWVKN